MLAEQPLGHPPVAPAGEPDAHAPLVELVAAPHEDRLVEAHEEADLVDRPPPVLGGEGVDREPLDAELERALDRVEQRLLAGRVALGALEAPLLRPPAVAVHHAGDVGGDASGSIPSSRGIKCSDRLEGYGPCRAPETAAPRRALAVVRHRPADAGAHGRRQRQPARGRRSPCPPSSRLFPLLLVPPSRWVGFVSSNDPKTWPTTW